MKNGFLLTRQSQDYGQGTVITLWLKTAQGAVKLLIENEQSVFFVTNEQAPFAQKLLNEQQIPLAKISPLSLKTFGQEEVTGFYFNTMRDFYSARDCLKTGGVKCYEDDFRPDDRYLMERFITAGISFIGDECIYQVKNGNSPGNQYLEVANARCRPQQVDIPLVMISVDIECAMDGALYSIGAYSDTCQKVFMIGPVPENIADCPGYIVWVENEVGLLNTFLSWLRAYDPDIIIGWNVINFDMDLLQKRCDKYDISFAIGRDNKPAYWRKNKNSEQKYLEIAGRVVLDGIDVLKTATYNFPSFTLDYVANTLLGLGKKVEDVDNRIKEITDNFLHNKPALAAYNLEDCRLVWLIFEETLLLDFAKLRAQLTGLSVDRVGGSVAAFTNLYLPKLHRSGYVAPNMGDGHSGLVSPGGYVMDSVPGLYTNVLVLDFKSLYPSIIRTFKIDPMGMIEGLKTPDTSIPGFDGAYFSREQHFLPHIIEDLWSERDKAKQDKNAALSQAIKIIMNSFYGVLGSSGCRFFDPRLSGSITKRSHAILKTTQEWIEDKGYKVIYGDTDSIFVDISANYDQKQSRALGKELQDLINEKWQQTIADDYGLESQLEIEFETHFSRFLMPTIRGLDVGTKKRYAGLVENDGKQKIIFKGLESVRTDWTELAKIFQRELYHKVFNNLEVADYIRDMVAKTRAGEFDDCLVYRKRLRRKLKDYVKNVPPHVKAARLADEQNAKEGKPLRYQSKGWVEYLLTLNGPQTKEHLSAPLDYDLYIERQLEAVADAILPFIGTSFAEITDAQLNLFS
ncbi:DNA polymerase II [Thalassomonas viridans]|uniref:DNA polymerase II n=1 Tax=Thalassomonas viridans TaxID=137584 RepID=UPI001EFF7B3C|nr:DNA polymerase II [Thalassomonas viridans]